jgi:phosphopantetheinyl transferase
MVHRHRILDADIAIWEGAEEAPVSIHPGRESIRLVSRKQEWDRVEQCLLPRYSFDHVIKNEHGQPSLLDGTFLSISHSDRYAATAISNLPIGIDIQVPHDAVFKVRNKFCHTEELRFLENNPQDPRHLMIWCAKEAIFKIYGHGLDFAKEIKSDPFSPDSGTALFHQHSVCHKKSELVVHFIKNPLYFVAIAQIKTP